MKIIKTASGQYKLSKTAWIEIGSKYNWILTAMGLEGQVQSFIKKVKSPKTGKEFYTINLYGNTQPIKDFLGKPKRGSKYQGEKLFFSYFKGIWSRIIPDGFIEELVTGKTPDDPKEQKKAENFKKSINRLKEGFQIGDNFIKADLSPLYDISNYGDEIQALEQSKITGVQKEIKDQVKEQSTAKEKLQTLQKFIDAEVNRIAGMTDEAKKSALVKSILSVAAKFYNYSFGNQILIWIQKPNSTMVASKEDWQKKFGREVFDYGDPITIRVPFFVRNRDITDSQIRKWKSEGMSDQEIWRKTHHLTFGAGSVYDISATTPIEGWTDKNGNGPYEPQNWRQDSNESLEEIEVIVNAAAQWAEQMSINVGYEKMDGDLGGYSAGGNIKINDKYDGINKFSTMIHEMAHEVLHWEAGKGQGVRSQMGKEEGRMAKEIDAESTAFIVLQHYGFDTADTPNYLALWQAKGEDVKARRKNISDSVRLIIKGIDDKIKNIELSEEQKSEYMEDEVDEHGIDMEKEKTTDGTEETDEIEETEETQMENEVEQTEVKEIEDSESVGPIKDIKQPQNIEKVNQEPEGMDFYNYLLRKEKEEKQNEETTTSATKEDKMLKIAQNFNSNKKTNLIHNLYGKLGL